MRRCIDSLCAKCALSTVFQRVVIDTCHIKNAQQLKLFSKLKPVYSDTDPDTNFFESLSHIMTIIIVMRNLMIS